MTHPPQYYFAYLDLLASTSADASDPSHLTAAYAMSRVYALAVIADWKKARNDDDAQERELA